MKIGFNPQSIVGLDGMPLVGRVTFYVHDSDVKATVYSMQGDEFVESQNPQLLNNAGRLDDTVFFDAAIIDVSIQQYIGETGHMTPDSPDEDFAPFDNFEIGFQIPAVESVTNVETIADLEDANTDAGVVLVTGYYEKGDSPARFYIWDEDANNTPDGGYVIASNNSDSGRWILLWDCDSIPSTLYGVFPGVNETNISSFLSYPMQVGSHLLRTSPSPRFVAGTYTTNTTLSSTKHIKFDKDAVFTYAYFSIPSCEIVPSSYPVADFYFTGAAQYVAESGWFRSFKAFLACNAKTLNFGADNFTDKVIDSAVAVTDKNVTGRGRINATYSSGAYIRFSNCNILAYKFLSPTLDNVQFLYCPHWSDSWWTSTGASAFDFGKVTEGHRTDFTSLNHNVLDIDDFADANVFVKATIADGANAIDLRGRQVYSVELSQVVTLVNGKASRIDLAAANVGLTNVECADMRATHTGNTALSLNGCKVTITTTAPKLSSLLSNDSEVVVSGSIDPATTTLVVYGGTWSGDVTMTDAELNEFTEHPVVYFVGVKFSAYSTFKVSNLYMDGCDILAQINLYAYRSGDDNLLSMILTNNRFTGTTAGAVQPRVWMGYFANSANQHEEVATHPLKFANMKIVNNRFEQSDSLGIYMPRWTFYGGNKAVDDGIANWEYYGNSGNCPKLSPGTLNGSEYDTQSGTWTKGDTTFNIWAPYVTYNDGSVVEAKNTTGLNGNAELVWSLAVGTSTNGTYIGGYYMGLDFPSDLLDIVQNNLFIVKSALTTGISAPAVTSSNVIVWPHQL